MADYIYGDDNNNGSNDKKDKEEERKTSDEKREPERERENFGSGSSDRSTSDRNTSDRGSSDRGSTGGGYGYGYGYDNRGGYGQYRYDPYTYQYGQEPPKPPKKRGGHTALIVVTVILATLLLATAAGIGGYMMTNGRVSDGSETNGSQSASTDAVTGDPLGVPPGGVVLAPGSSGISPAEKGTIAEVVTKVADSVVEVTTEYATSNTFYGVQYGAGSGVIISEKDGKGYIITNNHVITGDSGTATKITVRLTNGESYNASVVGADSDSDIAVLAIEAKDLTVAAIGTSSTLAVGEEIIVIGNPLGTLGGSVTNGIISALDREITVEDETLNLMQTNAAVNPGNSGGGMFNLAGELVGIVNAKYSEEGIEGLGFAIPIDDAVSVANEILDHGYVRGRVSLHISVLQVASVEDMLRYRVNALGLYVVEAESGYNDGVLKNGDRIATVNGVEIITTADLKAVLKGHNVGDKLTAYIVRNGNFIEVELTCFEKTTSDVQFDEPTSEE